MVWDYSSHTQFWCMSENSFDVLFDERTVVGVEQSECLNIVIRENIINSRQKYSPVIFKMHSEQWIYSVFAMENEDVLLAGTFDSQLIKFNLHTGEIIWAFAPFSSGPINIIRNVNLTIFVGASDNFVIAVDLFERSGHKYKSFLSMFKEVMNMHFFRRLRVKDEDDPEEEEAEKQHPQKQNNMRKKRVNDEENELQQKLLEKKLAKIRRNMDTVYYNSDDIIYPTGNRRKKQYYIFDRRFIFDEQIVTSHIFTKKELKQIRRKEKNEKKVYNFYSRIVISGKVRKENWKDPTNYLDISYLVKALDSKTREKWLQKEKQRKELIEEIYRRPIEIPKAEDFETEYSGGNRQKLKCGWCRKKTSKTTNSRRQSPNCKSTSRN